MTSLACPEHLDPWRTMSPRTRDVVRAARELLEHEGWQALTMRALGARLGITAPSLYKHVPSKQALGGHLTAVALAESGIALHEAVDTGGGVRGLLAAYRSVAHASPHLYRLATAGELDRDLLPAGLEDWSGAPFLDATGDPFTAQALWSTAHGLAILEIDRRYPGGSAPEETWERAAAAFDPTR